MGLVNGSQLADPLQLSTFSLLSFALAPFCTSSSLSWLSFLPSQDYRGGSPGTIKGRATSLRSMV